MTPDTRNWCDRHWRAIFFVGAVLTLGSVVGLMVVVVRGWLG